MSFRTAEAMLFYRHFLFFLLGCSKCSFSRIGFIEVNHRRFNMFIYSMRASTLKFFSVIAVSVAVLLALMFFIEPAGTVSASAESVETVNYSKIKTEEDRKNFLASFGWEVSGDAVEIGQFTIPSELDRVLLGYNEIQKSQGLDIGRYTKKKVTRYTYEVTNYQGYEGKVYANLIIYKNKVIAADICSADPFGFVHGLTK